MKTYFIIIGTFAVLFAGIIFIPAQGISGLVRHMLFKAFIVFCISLVVYLALTNKTKEISNRVILTALIFVSISVLCISSVAEIKDFTASAEIISIDLSSVRRIQKRDFTKIRRYYLGLPSGEEIEISDDTYFDLLGSPDHMLKIEYFPNSKVAVSVTSV